MARCIASMRVAALAVAMASGCPVDRFEISPGVCMPFANDGDVMKHTPSINDTVSTSRWLAAGGRGVDTAWSYDHRGYGLSQRQMGIGIKDFLAENPDVSRSDIFVTTKIPCAASEDLVAALLDYDLDQLMLGYVDLLLIHNVHAPVCNSSMQIAATWSGMQRALGAKKVRSIGVSNFETKHLEALLAAPTTTVWPAVNQCKHHVGHHDDETIAYCDAHNIAYMAYSPLGHPNGGGQAVYELQIVKNIAAVHNVSAAQVGLRWIVQQGHPFVTASGKIEYDVEDLDIFDWQLSADEMDTLTAVRESPEYMV